VPSHQSQRVTPYVSPLAQLGRTVLAYSSASAVSDDELRAVVASAARDLRAHGESPERALVAIKGEALLGLSKCQDRFSAFSNARRTLDRVVSWAIESYYDFS
jgi:hypothetical protein